MWRERGENLPSRETSNSCKKKRKENRTRKKETKSCNFFSGFILLGGIFFPGFFSGDGNCLYWEMSDTENAQRWEFTGVGKVRVGNVQDGKYPSGKSPTLDLKTNLYIHVSKNISKVTPFPFDLTPFWYQTHREFFSKSCLS